MEDEVRRLEISTTLGEVKTAAGECKRDSMEYTPNDVYRSSLSAGRAAYLQGNLSGAETSYRNALDLSPSDLPAWEGLALVQLARSNLHEGAATYTRLVGLARDKERIPKQREFLWRLAETHEKLGDLKSAELQLNELLRMPLDSEEQRLEALCFLADLQRKSESMYQEKQIDRHFRQQQAESRGAVRRSRSALRLQVDAERADEQLQHEDGLAATLTEIAKRTQPCPRYARYFEMLLQIYLSRLGKFPPRSSARQAVRMEAMRECVRQITTSAGGCTTPFPFEAAIWLLEEQEELYGGTFPVRSSTEEKGHLMGRQSSFVVQTKLRWYRGNSIHRMSIDKLNVGRYIQEPTVDEEGNADDDRPVATKHESFGVKLAHQFPWLGSASVAVGLALRRRFLSDPDAPSTALRRRQISALRTEERCTGELPRVPVAKVMV